MMKKTMPMLILCGITFCSSSFNQVPSRPKSVLRTIIIDPGHGGFDPGTHGQFTREKDIALGISLKLGQAIRQAFPDMKIVYTRTTDIMPGKKGTLPEGIRYRAELANKSNGDLFICIHCNSNGLAPGRYAVQKIVRYKMTGKGKRRKKVPVYQTSWVKNNTAGTATYIWKADRSGPKGDAINQRELGGENMGDSDNRAYDMTTPEARMRAQLYEKMFFANSALFGTLVENEFKKAGRHSYGVQQRQIGIGVLQATGMPSVLIETGFLTNTEEEKYLHSGKGQREVALNIVDALKRYKNRLEGHRESTGQQKVKTQPKRVYPRKR